MGVLRVTRLDVTGFSIDAHAQGAVAIGAGGERSDLTYRLDASDLSALSGLGLSGLEGGAHIQGEIQGPSARLTATGTFDAEEFKYGTAVDAVSVSGTFTGVLPDRNLAAATATADIESALMNVRSMEIQRLTAHAEYDAKTINLVSHVEQAARTVDVSGLFRLGADRSEIHVRKFTLAGPGAPWTLDTGGRDVVVRYSRDAVAVDQLAIVRGGARLEGGGVIALTPAGASDAAFHATFSGVDIGSLYQLASGQARVTGTAKGTLDLKGLVTNPTATASVEFDGVHVSNIALTNASARVDVADRRVSVDATVNDASGSTLTARGTIPIGAERRRDGRSRGEHGHRPGSCRGVHRGRRSRAGERGARPARERRARGAVSDRFDWHHERRISRRGNRCDLRGARRGSPFRRHARRHPAVLHS